MIVGTNHFISFTDAIRYYIPQEGLRAREAVIAKLREGLIAIGPPTLKEGEILTVDDCDTRYAIRTK